MTIHYVSSSLEPESWPKLIDPRGVPLPELVLAGRSNVGKSTLINLLAGRKDLAKISSTPGKTQRLQFFCLDQRIGLVDLPGFGYAKAPPHLQAEWSRAIDIYLSTRTSLRGALLLLDIRRSPNSHDLNFLAWCKARALNVVLVLTKTDTLSPRELERNQNELVKQLDPSHFFATVQVPSSRRTLLTILDQLICP